VAINVDITQQSTCFFTKIWFNNKLCCVFTISWN